MIIQALWADAKGLPVDVIGITINQRYNHPLMVRWFNTLEIVLHRLVIAMRNEFGVLRKKGK
jgi:hypothetical protein